MREKGATYSSDAWLCSALPWPLLHFLTANLRFILFDFILTAWVSFVGSSDSDSGFRLIPFSLSLSAGEFVEERKCPEEVKRSIHSYCYVLEVRQISASTRVRYFTCQLPFNWIRHHPGLFVCFFLLLLNLKASLLPWYEMMIYVKHGNSDFISEF